MPDFPRRHWDVSQLHVRSIFGDLQTDIRRTDAPHDSDRTPDVPPWATTTKIAPFLRTPRHPSEANLGGETDPLASGLDRWTTRLPLPCCWAPRQLLGATSMMPSFTRAAGVIPGRSWHPPAWVVTATRTVSARQLPTHPLPCMYDESLELQVTPANR